MNKWYGFTVLSDMEIIAIENRREGQFLDFEYGEFRLYKFIDGLKEAIFSYDTDKVDTWIQMDYLDMTTPFGIDECIRIFNKETKMRNRKISNDAKEALEYCFKSPRQV